MDEKVLEIIRNVLTGIGAFSIVFALIRAIWIFFITNIEWFDGVTITELSPNDSLVKSPNGECIFPQVYIHSYSDNKQVFLFRPKNAIIKKVKFKSLVYDKNLKLRKRRKTIKTFRRISPYSPLVIIISIPETIPNHSLCWHEDYGTKMEYIFHCNGRDGNVDSYGMSCKIGVKQKIRRIIGLK